MWKTHFSCGYCQKTAGMISIYLLPTIQFFRDDIDEDIGGHSFSLSFEWLFWSLTFIRYWGEPYKRKL